MSSFPIPRLVGWATVVLLVLAATGIYKYGFFFLKLEIFAASLALMYVSYRGNKHIWPWFFGLVAVLFNPFFPIHLSYDVWRVIDVVIALVFSFFLWNYYDSYGKGYSFEDYIASLFPSYDWVIADKTRDYSKKFNRLVESDSNPDFTFRHIKTNKTFAIECKYRSYFYEGGFGLTYKQLKNYTNFSSKNNIPVFVVLGVGGSPKKPQKLFSIPITNLDSSSSGFFSKEDLQKFERSPITPFTINGEGNLI